MPCSASAAISALEREALIALYNSTNGDDWKYNSGWKQGQLDADGFSVPGTENTWYGITCDNENTTVIEIDLKLNNLTGEIPPGLGNLLNLTYLNMWGNRLTGEIPLGLGNLINLTYLDFLDNQLTGNIPSELGGLTNLQELFLSSNQLTGSIPKELGDLLDLTDLVLCDNKLERSIPRELGNLSNLTYLCLQGNELTGPIPEEVGNLTNLKELFLSSNQLTGAIPNELDALTNLTFLELLYNALYANDDSLRTFLDDKNPGWEDTQTIAPKNVAARFISDTTVRVSWETIKYTADAGGYRVYFSAASGGPYTLFSTTSDKSISQMEVTGLNSNSSYYFVVQTQTEPHEYNPNAVYSEFSEEVSNDDEIDASEIPSEEYGPNGDAPDYDGNGDDEADSDQHNVTSMHKFDCMDYVTLASPDGTTMTDVFAADNPSPDDAPVDADFPYGFFLFTINDVGAGGSTKVTLYLPTGATAPTTYYKYGPEPAPGDTSPHWYDFMFDGQTGAEINGNIITLHFVDGMQGDDDLDDTNGTIVDLGAPALERSQPNNGGDGGGGGCFLAVLPIF